METCRPGSLWIQDRNPIRVSDRQYILHNSLNRVRRCLHKKVRKPIRETTIRRRRSDDTRSTPGSLLYHMAENNDNKISIWPKFAFLAPSYLLSLKHAGFEASLGTRAGRLGIRLNLFINTWLNVKLYTWPESGVCTVTALIYEFLYDPLSDQISCLMFKQYDPYVNFWYLFLFLLVCCLHHRSLYCFIHHVYLCCSDFLTLDCLFFCFFSQAFVIKVPSLCISVILVT